MTNLHRWLISIVWLSFDVLTASAESAHCNQLKPRTEYVKCMLYTFSPSCKHLIVQVE